MAITLLKGDCRLLMPAQEPVDVVIADPPYGDTSLEWDRRVEGWLDLVRPTLKPTGSLWCFGSLKFFMAHGADFERAGFKIAQDVVWEKHNGSSFHADRFKRVHELSVQFYPSDVPWEKIYKNPVKTLDATARTTRRKQRPAHTGSIESGVYTSQDGAPRLMTSVIFVRSCHGYAEHPTQKPEGIIAPLIEFSCPPGGVIGDWFAGAGSVGVVAAKMGRQYVGCEIDDAYHDVASKRLAAVGSDLFVRGVA